MSRAGNGSSAQITASSITTNSPASFSWHCRYWNDSAPGGGSITTACSIGDSGGNWIMKFTWMHSSGAGRGGIQCQTSTGFRALQYTGLGANTWYSLGCMVTAAGVMTLYLNGAVDVSNGTAGAMATGYTLDLSIHSGAGAQYDDGIMAEFAFWPNTELTTDEWAAVGTDLLAPNMIRPQALGLYYPLWGYHSPELDLAPGGANPGTVTNATYSEHTRVFRPHPIDLPWLTVAPSFISAWASKSNVLIQPGIAHA